MIEINKPSELSGSQFSAAVRAINPGAVKLVERRNKGRDGDTYVAIWDDEIATTPSEQTILDAAIEAARASAVSRIDEAAGEARARFITTSPGQESVYAMKREHATAYKAAGYTGDVPAMVAAEASAQGMTATEAADFILATAAGWITVAAAIEQLRQAGKTAIKAATTVEAVETILADTVEALDQIMP